MANRYYCSNGERVSQVTINNRRQKRYSEHFELDCCAGCGGPATCRAHIIAQARCKVLHKTELIWNPENWFLSCNACNSAIESYKSDACYKLFNYNQCLEVLKKYDQEMYLKHVTFGHASTLE